MLILDLPHARAAGVHFTDGLQLSLEGCLRRCEAHTVWVVWPKRHAVAVHLHAKQAQHTCCASPPCDIYSTICDSWIWYENPLPCFCTYSTDTNLSKYFLVKTPGSMTSVPRSLSGCDHRGDHQQPCPNEYRRNAGAPTQQIHTVTLTVKSSHLL